MIFRSSALGLVILAAACSEGSSGASQADSKKAVSSPISDPANSTASVNALQRQGEQTYAAGDIESARALFQQALTGAETLGESAAMARSLTWLAQTAWRLGDYQATREEGEKALAIKLRSVNPDDLFRSYNVLGLLAWNESRPLDAIRLFERAAAEAASDTTNLAKVWNNLGLVAMSLGNFEEARTGFEAARGAAAALGEPLIEGRTLINLGTLDLEVGNPRSAIAYLEASAPLLEVAGDVIGEQVLLGHLGTAHGALGEPGRAMAYLDSALHRARTNGLRQEEAINLEQLAELHREAGDHRGALMLFAEARQINLEMGLADEVAIDLRSESEIHAELGDMTLALEKVRRALTTHREIGSRLQEIHDLVQLAELAAREGLTDSTRALFTEAEILGSVMDARSVRLSIALGRARVARQWAQPREALAALKAVQEDLDAGGYASEWEVEALRAWAFAAIGDLDSASSAGVRALAAAERVRHRYGSGSLRAAHLAAREEAYSDQVMVLLRMGRVGEAFETADRARGRSLLEQLLASRGENETGRVAGDLFVGEELLRRINELADRMDEIEANPPESRSPDLKRQASLLRQALEEARAAYTAALVRAGDVDPRGTTLLGGAPMDRRSVGKALRPDEALLEYHVTGEGVLLFVVTPDSIRYFSAEVPRTTLASRVRVARAATGSGEWDPENRPLALERLFDTLIEPAVRSGVLQNTTRLLIVPHGELTYLPFAALWNESTGRYLVQDYVITHLPSAAILPVLRVPSEAGHLTASGLAPFPEELPATRTELVALNRAVPGTRTSYGGEATEARLREDLASGRSVHVATHGLLNPRNPMFSRIALARGTAVPHDDGRLEVHELLGLRINSPIVYLSGCETGVGAEWSTSFARGDDFANLSQAFLYAGARTVIATLWPVQDEGASRFAELFYLGVPRLDVGEALAQTQRAMIADPRYAAPYYWAAYRLSGSSDLLLTAQTAPGASVSSSSGQTINDGSTR